MPLDSLASQDSLTYDAAHHLLFAVNAGSNTVTSFAVDGAHLTRLQTVPSGGVFPVSVQRRPRPAVRAERRRLPATSPATGSTRPAASPRSRAPARDLGLDNEPRPEFITAPADIAQTPDGEHVIVTTKANNDIDVFNVSDGGLSAPIKNRAASAVPFAVSFDVHAPPRGRQRRQLQRQHLHGQRRRHAGHDHGGRRGRAGRAVLAGRHRRHVLRRQRRQLDHQRVRRRRRRQRHLTGTPDGVVAHTGGGSGGTIDLAITARPAVPVRGEQLRRIRRGLPDPARPHAAAGRHPTGLPQFNGHGMEGLVAL